MTNELLDLAQAEEIVISFVRPDGTRGSTPIWDVEVGNEIYIRSGGGTSGGWYRRLRTNPEGEVHLSGNVYPVRAEPVGDTELQSRVTEAYRAKYGGSPSLHLPRARFDRCDATPPPSLTDKSHRGRECILVLQSVASHLCPRQAGNQPVKRSATSGPPPTELRFEPEQPQRARRWYSRVRRVPTHLQPLR